MCLGLAAVGPTARGDAAPDTSRPAWLGSRAGVVDGVLPGFAGIESHGNDIRPWGRLYRYADGPLPSLVECAGEMLFDSPPRLLLDVGEGLGEVRGGSYEVLERSAQRVRLRYTCTLGAVRVEEEVTVEYDGMARHDLRLVPSGKTPLRKLIIEIPFRTDRATLNYRFPGTWGNVSNAGAVPPEGMALPFFPFVWLGDEDRGMAWFTESDQGWSPADPARAILVGRDGATTVLRLNVVGKPRILDAPVAYTFGLQATPVRPPGPDAWDMRIVHGASFDLDRRPPAVPASIEYPAPGNIRLDRGSVEFWARAAFDDARPVPDGVRAGGFNRDLFDIRWPDGDRIALYWNVEDRGLRFFIRQKSAETLVVPSTQRWERGAWHRVRLGWGSSIRVSVDGTTVAERRWKGTVHRSLKGAVMRLGGDAPGFDVDELTITPRDSPAAGDGATLVDHLDSSGENEVGDAISRPGRSAPGTVGRLLDGAVNGDGRIGGGLRLVPPDLPASQLDRYRDLGVRTLVFHEGWTDIQNYPTTSHDAALKALVAACHARGIQLLLYFGYEMSDRAPEYAAWSPSCLVEPRGGGYRRQPEQTAWKVCYRSPWADFLADGIARAMDAYDIDGVYLDGTARPHACANGRHGCGYVRSDGSRAPTYPIFAVREVMKRIYTIVKSRRPDGLVNVHNSSVMTIPTLAWATSTWDGEQLASVAPGAELATTLPLDAFRAEFMGRQWGVPSELLCYEGRPFTYDQAVAMALLHDVPVRGPAERAARLWRFRAARAMTAADFEPYWRFGGRDLSGNPVKVSAWRSTGGVTLAAVNLGRTSVPPPLEELSRLVRVSGGASDAALSRISLKAPQVAQDADGASLAPAHVVFFSKE